MKIGLIGYGSIGKRHVKNLIDLGYSNIILLRKIGRGNEFGFNEVSTISDLLNENLDCLIIASPTSEHFEALQCAMSQNVNILVEKPIVALQDEIVKIEKLMSGYSGKNMVAFNTRFHPCVRQVQNLLNKKIIGKIYSSRFFIGQYLPDWHPEKDYKTSYSALKSLGGGVVLDLIHEIDLATFLAGPCGSKVLALCGKISNLEIETEDCAEILYKTNTGSFVSIHLDYLYRGYRRQFEMTGEKGSLFCDLFNNTILCYNEKQEVIYQNKVDNFVRNDMYCDMVYYYMDCIKNNLDPSPSFYDALALMVTAVETKQQIV